MDSVELIVSTSNLVRKHWLPLELAIERIVQFEHDFGSADLIFACHAALPSIITPRLLNLIRINFLETAVEWVAESDLLLSPLYNSIGEAVFEMEPQIREILLIELKSNPIYGQPRLEALATLLRDYTEDQSTKTLPITLKRTYRWIAGAYLTPDIVISDMFNWMKAIKPHERLATLGAQVQIGKTLELLAEPLEQTNLQVELEDLLSSTRILAHYWYDDRRDLARILQRDRSIIDNDGVSNVLSKSVAGWIITTEGDASSAEVSTPPGNAKEALPSSIDLRPECPPVYDGGQLGGVVANALAAALEFCMMKQKLDPVFTPSRLFMYYNERSIEGTVSSDSGSMIADGIKSVETYGVCPETMWPYDIAKFTERPIDACYQAALQYRIFDFKQVQHDLVEMKQCLASGYPFIFGISVYQSFQRQEVAQSGHAPLPSPDEQVIGGHAALAVGYDDANQWFIVRNSWGTNWGMQGYFTLPYAFITNPNLSSDFWTARIDEALLSLQKQRHKSGIICLVTLHGIGFQQPPQPELGIPGYADDLHQNLSKFLDGTMLGDDPMRARHQRGENGPVYVQSWYPPNQPDAKSGLSRLGDWTGKDHRDVDVSNAPLVDGDQRIAHVALVYSHLESASSSSSIYTSTKKTIHGVLNENPRRVGYPTPSKTVDEKEEVVPSDRDDEKEQPAPSLWSRIRTTVSRLSPESSTILTALENDIASYVSNNALRERVRSFVSEALLRLASRDDVGEIVLNTHSNGTVIAFDILSQLPPFAVAKIRVFITAGSPLRQYVNLFNWGRQIESMNPFPRWFNFWDPLDPVADPLVPSASWQRGDRIVPPYYNGLFLRINPNTGQTTTIEIQDRRVDNVRNSLDGEFKAHNYWDNESEFVRPLAQILKQLTEEKPESLFEKVRQQQAAEPSSESS